MANFVSPLGIAVLAVIASAGVSGCSTYATDNQLAATNGVPCVYDNAQQAMSYQGNVGGAIGGRMVLGATPAENKPLCRTQ